jgi:predicted RNase H-like HicB family nuclease
MAYTVVLTKDEDGDAYNAAVPALPGCYTWGATEEEAYINAKEAIALYLEHLQFNRNV